MMMPMTLDEAAKALGLAASTLRRQVANGSLTAAKHGGVWWVTAEEVERYRERNLGRRGRMPKPKGEAAALAAIARIRERLVEQRDADGAEPHCWAFIKALEIIDEESPS